MYCIAQLYPLADLIALFRKKYAGFDYNFLHLLKSLVYFADAENDAMPTMIEKISWKKVKEFLQKEAKSIGKSL